MQNGQAQSSKKSGIFYVNAAQVVRASRLFRMYGKRRLISNRAGNFCALSGDVSG